MRRPRLPPPSPEIQALGALWRSLTDFTLLGLALFWVLDSFAPPQDLYWKPLRLADPPGLMTRVKFARVAVDRSACRAILREGGVTFSEAPERTDGACGVLNAGRLEAGVTPLSPAGPVMTCPEALAYAFWDRHSLRPAAREVLGRDVASVTHFGTYACRNVYGRPEARLSEHAFANALDVSAFRLKGGGQVSVLADFGDAGPKGAFLRRVRDEACGWFKVTLSPDYNAAHANHIHLDMGR